MTLSLCMIVKNEEKNLPTCLESVKDLVNEMIIVDTGSTDSTVEIAEKYGAKVFSFKWNNNFSDARNFSLEHAVGDWVLLMDADDEFEKEDKDKLFELLKNDDIDAYFLETLSYVGDKPGLDIVMNLNVRLVRNHRGYKFVGAIHEQIASNIVDINSNANIATDKVRFHHYGYLNKNVKEKDKRTRNISIIEKSLEENQNDSFMLFNMGNEYFALNDYIKALEYYKKSYEKFDPNTGYGPKLLIRMAMAHDEMGKFDDELEIIEAGLKYYPNYTDLEYLRACVYHKQNKFTLAIKSYMRCIKLGEAPTYLSFIVGVGSYRAHHALSEIYFELGDYDEAYNCCIEALKIKSDFMSPFYKIAKILFKKENNDDCVKAQLEGFFGGNLDGPAYVTLSDIFFGEGKYDTAYEYITKVESLLKLDSRLLYFKGMCLFYLKSFEEACQTFCMVESGEFFEKAKYNMFLCKVLSENIGDSHRHLTENVGDCHRQLTKFENSDVRIVYETFKDLVEDKNCKSISKDKKQSANYLNIIFDLLDTLIKISNAEIFQKSLQLLMLIESDEALLKLAKLYYVNGFYDLAYQEFIKSIKMSGKLDPEGLDMMRKILMHCI